MILVSVYSNFSDTSLPLKVHFTRHQGFYEKYLIVKLEGLIMSLAKEDYVIVAGIFPLLSNLSYARIIAKTLSCLRNGC
jgi:hypothetical protein